MDLLCYTSIMSFCTFFAEDIQQVDKLHVVL